VQKDWALFDSFELPEEFAIAVWAHKRWNHLDGVGTARYCLAVTFEVMRDEVPIHTLVENAISIEADSEVRVQTEKSGIK